MITIDSEIKSHISNEKVILKCLKRLLCCGYKALNICILVSCRVHGEIANEKSHSSIVVGDKIKSRFLNAKNYSCNYFLSAKNLNINFVLKQ
jgi:hypothetical protein